MSISATNAVKRLLKKDDGELKPFLRLLLIIIAEYAGPDGTCFPSIATLASLTGGSESTVKRGLTKLEQLHWIRRSPRRSETGAQTSNLIEILALADGGSTCTPRGSIVTRGEGHSCAPPGGSAVNPPYIEPSDEPLDESSIATVAERQTKVKPDLAELSAKLMTAGGQALNPTAIGLQFVSEPIGWITQGCDLELDILPVVTALSRKAKSNSVWSWNYYAKAVSNALEARKHGLPPPSPAARRPSHMGRY